MTKRVLHRRGSESDHNSFTGEEGEFTYDTTLKNLRVHDGARVGGFLLVREFDTTSSPNADTVMRRDANGRTQVEAPVDAKDAANKDFVDSVLNGLDWQESVIDQQNDPAGTPSEGDRYLIGSAPTGDWSGHADEITEYLNGAWEFIVPDNGFAVIRESDDTALRWNGTSWVNFGSAVKHNVTQELQGGTSGEYYHLTSQEHSYVQHLGSNPLQDNDLAANGGTVPETDQSNTFSADQTIQGSVNAEELYENGNRVETISRMVGEIFALSDDLAGVNPPSNSGNVKHIKLTAGQDGAGQYNEGLLTSESVSGSAPLVVATAVIDDASSPMNGQTVHLLNTENRYLMPGTSPGTTAYDQMQQITGEIEVRGGNAGVFGTEDGALSGAGSTNSILGTDAGTASPRIRIDSADSASARTGDHTNVKHMQATFYMRIR